MKFTAFLLLVSYSILTEATIFPLFPRLGCFARFATFRFDITKDDKFPKYFHHDSAMTVWQTGRYVGAEAILEYVNFVSPLNPLWSSYRELDSSVKFAGFDRKTNQCKFLSFYHYTYKIDEASGNVGTDYEVANMVKLYFDVKERYIPKINVFYTEDYVDLVFRRLFGTEEIRSHVCNVYEGITCSAFLDPPVDCMAQLNALVQTGTDGRVDGNSIACRMLHSVLAEERNVHCPHISFEPLEDFQGRIKCQTEGTVTVYDLFTQGDLDAYAEYASGKGLDPDIGHDWTNGTSQNA